MLLCYPENRQGKEDKMSIPAICIAIVIGSIAGAAIAVFGIVFFTKTPHDHLKRKKHS